MVVEARPLIGSAPRAAAEPTTRWPVAFTLEATNVGLTICTGRIIDGDRDIGDMACFNVGSPRSECVALLVGQGEPCERASSSSCNPVLNSLGSPKLTVAATLVRDLVAVLMKCLASTDCNALQPCPAMDEAALREFADELLHLGTETCGAVSEPATVVLNEVCDAFVMRPYLLSRRKESRPNAQYEPRREATTDLGADSCQKIHWTSIRERADAYRRQTGPAGSPRSGWLSQRKVDTLVGWPLRMAQAAWP